MHSIARVTTLLMFLQMPACEQAEATPDAADSSSDTSAAEGAIALTKTITGFSIVDADGLVYALRAADRTATGHRLDEGHVVAQYVSDQSLSGVWRTTSGAVRGPWLAGELSEPPINTRIDTGVVQLVAGTTYFAARTTDGEMYLWGSNVTRPQLFAGITDATFLATTDGLDSESALQVVLGDGRVVQVQRRGTSTEMEVVTVDGLAGVAQIALGNEFACALSTTGEVRCFGDNDKGQLGDGSTTSRTVAEATVVVQDATEITCGGEHACARMRDGSVRCWGNNVWGGAGAAPSETPVTTPTVVPGIDGVTAIVASLFTTCALRDDGAVWCWGMTGGAPIDPTAVAPTRVTLTGEP